MKTVAWKREPKGPGIAYHMFMDAGGLRVELLAYDCPASSGGGRMCGFEIYAPYRVGGPFWDQLAAGEAENIEAAKAAAIKMAGKPREMWTVLPRSWVA